MNQDMPMTSNRPYLIRAVYEWLLDNGLTPYLLVNVEAEGVVVPEGFGEDGRIVLNIAPSAVRTIDLGNEMIYFNARFRGRPMDVFMPPSAVLALYARENGRGLLYPDEPEAEAASEATQQPPRPRPSVVAGGKASNAPDKGVGGKGKRPALRVVK